MNIFKFVPAFPNKKEQEMLVEPTHAYKKIPQWYKDLGPFGRGGHDIKNLNPINNNGSDGTNVSTKACTPFMDAMMSGYVYCLEDDLTVTLDDNGYPELSWEKPFMFFDKRPLVDTAIPQDCHPIQFGMRMNWYYETPPGYSTLFTHPLNRYDLPFYTSSAIVDSDIWGLPVFIPMFFKKNFFGTIKAGTPVFQMLPFKRDDWRLEIDYSEDEIEKHKILEEKRRTHLWGHYRKSVWQKKQF